MAELLAAEGWVKTGSTGAYLRENLPAGYYVVADPLICGQQFAAAVVGCGALFIIASEDAEAAIPAPASKNSNDQPGAAEAVKAFLKDEFPSLTVHLVAVHAMRDWAADLVTWRVVQPADWADQPLAETIVEADSEGSGFLDEASRRALAVGLRDRQLTASQAASRPFVFKSGGGLRTGTPVNTVRDAMAHMDRYPADGMQVLRDGTLAQWLEEEGALHVADLARAVVRQPKADQRIPLENFLLGSGLVPRPVLVAKPATLDLGYVLQGQQVSRRLRLELARGSRGYLFGSATVGAQWLRVDPREFAGSSADLTVTAEIEGLKISVEPYVSKVLLSTNASVEPVAIPVTLCVTAAPPPLIRGGVRPLTGFLIGALLGAGIALLWPVAGLVAPRHTLLGVAGLALVWGVAGALRASRQPPAWPIQYALVRWLFKVLLWSAGLAVLAAIIVEAWRLGVGGGLRFENLSLASAAVLGAALGGIAATIHELQQCRRAVDQGYVHGQRSSRRPVLLAASGVLLLLVMLLAPPSISRTFDGTEAQARLTPAKAWVEARWNEFGESMDSLTRDLTLRYYNKPAGGTTRSKEPLIRLPRVLGGR